eukprot:6213366-Pleurochrysis_carterae.AAC.1
MRRGRSQGVRRKRAGERDAVRDAFTEQRERRPRSSGKGVNGAEGKGVHGAEGKASTEQQWRSWSTGGMSRRCRHWTETATQDAPIHLCSRSFGMRIDDAAASNRLWENGYPRKGDKARACVHCESISMSTFLLLMASSSGLLLALASPSYPVSVRA